MIPDRFTESDFASLVRNKTFWHQTIGDMTPLMIAVQHQPHEVIEFLVEHCRVDLNARSGLGFSACMFAAAAGTQSR